MPRRRIKLGLLAGGLALSAVASPPAKAQNPTTVEVATNVPAADVRAHLWAATARYVYNDDPALAGLRPQLLRTIDSSSVKAFGRRLEEAVRLEQKARPKQGHLLKLLELFKTVSTSADQPTQLATTITSTLLANKPERKSQPSFAQLSSTLHTLASPPAAAGSMPVAATTPASPDTTAAAAPPVAAAPVATPAASPAYLTPISSTPMIAWVALALSIISLLVALLKSNSRGRHRHSNSSSSLALTTLTDEMRAEVRTMVQREVSKQSGVRPTADTPPRTTSPAAAPKNAPAKATTPAPKAPSVAVPAPPAVPVPAAPASPPEPPSLPEPVASPPQDDAFFDENYPVDTVAAPPVVPSPTRTLYANQQPIDGIFKRDMLAEAPASYTIFELTMGASAPDQAQFVVTSNAAGHAGYIGSHQNILGGACEYPFPKGSVSRIITDVPGQAQRTASGDWQITRKAQVHFE